MERTLLIIKPDAVSANNIGNILCMVERAGFAIKAQKMIRITKEMAVVFYAEHKERPFFNSLVDYMTSGPCVVCVVGARVADMRDLIGATDPGKATDGTIRKAYGKSIEANAVHASDSVTSAENEIKIFFAGSEILR